MRNECRQQGFGPYALRIVFLSAIIVGANGCKTKPSEPEVLSQMVEVTEQKEVEVTFSPEQRLVRQEIRIYETIAALNTLAKGQKADERAKTITDMRHQELELE